VLIIDELADLMQTSPADVESAIARMAADGARRRHSSGGRNTNAACRRHYRRDQSKHSKPHRFPSRKQDR
jgi:hypothetical protein